MSDADLRESSTPSDQMDLAEIREGTINVKVLSSGKKAIVLRRGQDIQVFGELCPHMGADLSDATYCASAGTLACKWHGYVFGVDDGVFRDNPNERLMTTLRGESRYFRPNATPRYRLRTIAFQIKGAVLYFGAQEQT